MSMGVVVGFVAWNDLNGVHMLEEGHGGLLVCPVLLGVLVVLVNVSRSSIVLLSQPIDFEVGL